MLTFNFFPLFASEIPDYETCKHLLNIIHPPHHEQYTLDSIKVMLACKHFVYTLAADSSLMEKYLDISDLDYIHRLCYAAFHFKQYAIVKKTRFELSCALVHICDICHPSCRSHCYSDSTRVYSYTYISHTKQNKLQAQSVCQSSG